MRAGHSPSFHTPAPAHIALLLAGSFCALLYFDANAELQPYVANQAANTSCACYRWVRPPFSWEECEMQRGSRPCGRCGAGGGLGGGQQAQHDAQREWHSGKQQDGRLRRKRTAEWVHLPMCNRARLGNAPMQACAWSACTRSCPLVVAHLLTLLLPNPHGMPSLCPPSHGPAGPAARTSPVTDASSVTGNCTK